MMYLILKVRSHWYYFKYIENKRLPFKYLRMARGKVFLYREPKITVKTKALK